MQRDRLNISERVAETAALGLLVLAIAFGGGSRGTGDLVVHLAAALALPIVAVRASQAPLSPPDRWLQWWFLVAASVLALQLLPLPPHMWQHLPLRDALTDDLTQAGHALTWRAMSLEPWGTVRALLWLMVGYVAWRLTITLPAPARLRWVQVAVVLGVAMALLGFAQAAAGRQPTLRFHPFHNEFGASGTFANRNHFALLMAMLAPLAIGLARLGQARRQPGAIAWYAAAVLLVLAAALSFSRAGFLLAAVGTMLAAAWAWRWQAPAEPHGAARRGLALVAAGALTVSAVATYAWTQLAARLEKDPLDDLRFQYLEHGLSAVKAYLPWGSGVGSFRWAYAPFEPGEAMVNAYALHAHNELLEVALELGVPGLLLLLSGLAAVAWAAWQFRQTRRPAGLPWAVISVALAMPLVHSLVDYPLRALSVLVVFAGVLAQLAPQGSDHPSTKKPFTR